MVHALHHFALENFFQIFQVQNHSGCGVRLARDSHFEGVVVAVAMRIIAFPKDAPVFLRREIRIVIKVRGGELDFAREEDHGVWPIVSFICVRREE